MIKRKTTLECLLPYFRDKSLPPTLPRSRHLPVASTEGSLTENPNEIGVRLWTERSLVATLVEPCVLRSICRVDLDSVDLETRFASQTLGPCLAEGRWLASQSRVSFGKC